MAGDEIVANWLGDVYSDNFLTATVPQRLHTTSLRFKNVSLQNYHASYSAWIGKYNSNTAAFIADAFYMRNFEEFFYEFVDLYELGASSVGAGQHSSIKILGINEY